MPRATKDFTKPKRKRPITDRVGNYDMDGVTQDDDFEVIVASDKTSTKKPAKALSPRGLKLNFKKWVASWDDDKQ